MRTHKRKRDEEHKLPRSIYFGDAYFSREQLIVYVEQIHLARKYGASPFLEIGPGNGFLSSILKRAGSEVTTMDVNKQLEPDVFGSVLEEPRIFKPKSFDTILCFEVLEHLPWEEFSRAIENISLLCSRTAIISLPRAKRSIFKFVGLVKLPRIGEIKWDVKCERRRQEIYEGHHWEIDWSNECTERKVLAIMKESFCFVDSYVFPHNRYFEFFVCSHQNLGKD